MNLKKLSEGNVLVFGDIILDRYLSGTVDRVSPEAPVPVLRPHKEETRLGGAANVALNLSSLDCKVTLIGALGKDAAAGQVTKLLKKNKIKTALTKSLHPTISKLRILASQQQLLRIDNEEEFSDEDWQSSLSQFKKHVSLDKNKVLIISDYDKGTLKNIPSLISAAKKKNKLVLVDPKGKDFGKYKGADVITPNLSEFEDVVGKIKSENNLTKKGKDLIKTLNLKSLLIKHIL